MQTLYTIEEAHKMFPTRGSSPLLVTCNDLQDWVCKYDRAPLRLLNELLAAKFAELWEIKTPKTALIRVKKKHVPINKFPSIQPYLLEKECFGSLYLPNTIDVNNSLVPSFRDPIFRKKLNNKQDFLKIALFDIWLANEDRNHNNFNLLLYASPEQLNFLYAIDHVDIFNSSYLNYGITDITEEDSIIKTEIAKILFGNERKLTEIVDDLIKKFYLCTAECYNNLDEILDLIPESWGINKRELRRKIVRNLFVPDWTSKCIENFRRFIQISIVN